MFCDVASIRPGENFRQAIAHTLRKCDAVMVVIGPDWTMSRSEDGTLRLHDPDDIVRSEVAAALDSGALVIPVLLRGAAMPRQQDLPTDLHGLVDLHAVSINDQQFEDSLAAIVDVIVGAPIRRTPLLLLIFHVAIFVLILTFYLADGFTDAEFTTSLAIISSLLAATGAVTVVHALDRGKAPARIRQVPVAALLVPLSFTGACALLVVLKSMNVGITSFETFKLYLGAVELFFGAYTGLILASLFENRGKQ